MAPKILFGTVIFGDTERLPLASQAQPFLDILKEHNVNQLDSAYNYPSPMTPTLSEKVLGELKAGEQGFIIDTKVKSFAPGDHSYDNIMKSIDVETKLLKIPQINTLYLHAPDRSTSFEETHRAMDELYKKGVYKNFGLSNYTPEDVKIFIANAKKHGWVAPTVYQGLYNLVSRTPEKELLPLLKANGIVFYAYSPLAGGFFSNVRKDQAPAAGGRFALDAPFGAVFQAIFYKDSVFEASEALAELAAKHGLSSNAVALRWIRYHSALSDDDNNAVILGGSRTEQVLENVINAQAGPLPEEVVAGIERLWDIVKAEPPTFDV